MIPGQKIFLVGMPCSGKSTLGKKLANQLSIAFFDLDDEIEKREKISIEQIFSNYNEAYFRQLEKQKLLELAHQAIPMLVATGGGTPCFFDNMQLMNKIGTTIFIDIPVDELATRLRSTNLDSRPLFRGLSHEQLIEKLKDQYTERKKYYKQATYTFDANINIEDILNTL